MFACLICQVLIQAHELIEILLRQVFEVQQGIVRSACRANEFIQFDMNRAAITILRILYQEHHKKSYDRRPGIDYQLPCVTVSEQLACPSPDKNNQDSSRKGPRMAHGNGAAFRKTRKKTSVSLHMCGLFLNLH